MWLIGKQFRSQKTLQKEILLYEFAVRMDLDLIYAVMAKKH